MQSNLYAKIAILNLLFLKALSDRVWIIYLCFFFLSIVYFQLWCLFKSDLRIPCLSEAMEKLTELNTFWVKKPLFSSEKIKIAQNSIAKKRNSAFLRNTNFAIDCENCCFFRAKLSYATKEIFWISVRKILRNETLFRNHYLKKILT